MGRCGVIQQRCASSLTDLGRIDCPVVALAARWRLSLRPGQVPAVRCAPSARRPCVPATSHMRPAARPIDRRDHRASRRASLQFEAPSLARSRHARSARARVRRASRQVDSRHRLGRRKKHRNRHRALDRDRLAQALDTLNLVHGLCGKPGFTAMRTRNQGNALDHEQIPPFAKTARNSTQRQARAGAMHAGFVRAHRR